jgi:hypothetical protein
MEGTDASVASLIHLSSAPSISAPCISDDLPVKVTTGSRKSAEVAFGSRRQHTGVNVMQSRLGKVFEHALPLRLARELYHPISQTSTWHRYTSSEHVFFITTC